MQFSVFKDEVGPGVAKTPKEFSITELTILVLITQDGQMWPRYPRMRDALAANRENLRQSSPLQVKPRFRRMKIASFFLFSELPIV